MFVNRRPVVATGDRLIAVRQLKEYGTVRETKNEDVLALWRENLKKSLRERRVTLGDASLAAGKNAEYLSRVLSGKINPTMDTIIIVCRNHDIPFTELFSGVRTIDDGTGDFMGRSSLTEESARIASALIRPPKEE